VAALDTGVSPAAGQTGAQVYRFVEQLLVGDELEAYKRRLLRALYWPRVDDGPLRSDHLLKVPFCVHEKTKKVSMPLPSVEGFQPSSAPKLEDVLLGNFDLEPSAKYMRSVLDAARSDPPRSTTPTRTPPSARYSMRVDWRDDATPEGYAELVARVARVFREHRVVVEVPDHEWAARVQAQTLDTSIAVTVSGSDDPLPLEPDVWVIALAGEEPQEARKASQFIVLSDFSADSGLVVENADQAETLAKRVRQQMMLRRRW
jgi:hypothetical protein